MSQATSINPLPPQPFHPAFPVTDLAAPFGSALELKASADTGRRFAK